MVKILLVGTCCVSSEALARLGVYTRSCSAEEYDTTTSPDLVLVSSITSCVLVRKTLKDTPVIFISPNNLLASIAFKLGCLDHILITDIEKVTQKLLSYGKIAQIEKTLKKLLDKPL
jgi:hypothetical protein